MKKWILLAALVVLASSPARALDLRLAHVYETSHPWHIGAAEAADKIRELTEGRVNIIVYPSSVLGSEADITEQVVTGGLDIAETGSAQISNLWPAFNITAMPYIFRDNDHALQFMKDPKYEEIKEAFFRDTGSRIIGSGTWGLRHIIGNREIRTPDDLDDFRLRVPDQKVTVQYALAMGAKPTPTAYAEAYMALQQNVVDGLENPLSAIVSMKFEEVAKVVSLTGHVISLTHFIVNNDSYEMMSPEDQKIFTECMIEAGFRIHDMIDEADANLQPYLKDAGCTIVECDRDAFVAKTRSMVDAYADDWKEFGDLYQYIQDLK